MCVCVCGGAGDSIVEPSMEIFYCGAQCEFHCELKLSKNNVLQNYVCLLYVFVLFNTYSFLLQVSKAALSHTVYFYPHSKSK